ncbi:MAG: bifunctional phosphoribosylaminoimidazolecarboxamide formyltransferase/IMP cyclohydrolase PurH [Candidatus Methanoliparum thermophilum]|uniref:Bifunctional phosphoribosylaminoimidazolecarboxamide formyltransferase/IMP cyclohydrolase PurH n=1 Tax=Methanoliparum thermophilum TaxID=2491083 RepID=A0A520KTJ6_METT2|nr:MAG: bifunctional phosphoribosylaminoimidazolecarboxamide formyltransferase/IMP cyclohydrolase PurH [Candidatus Methanoliparum thermophilum]
MVQIKNALIKTWNKEGLVDFAKALLRFGILVKSDEEGSEFFIREGINTENLNISSYPDIDEDIIVINLKPISLIDDKELLGYSNLISLINNGAKSYEKHLTIVDPKDYNEVVERLKDDRIDLKFRKRLAAKALNYAIKYDIHLAKIIYDDKFPDILNMSFEKREDLKYGENYHQNAAFYLSNNGSSESISSAIQLQGKKLSYNNVMDANNAIECIKEFDKPTVVIMKHATPTGIASSNNLVQAWKDAFETDTDSPFGGIVSINREMDKDLAEELSKLFLEIIIAPSFSDESREILGKKKNLILLEVRGIDRPSIKEDLEFRSVSDGLIIQDRDTKKMEYKDWRVVTEKRPSEEDIETMVFGFKCVKWVRSNAIVFVKDNKTVGIGGGQTSRVDSSRIAINKGKDRINGSIMASDAFFPFRDAIDVVAKRYKLKAIIQPGGSIRDKEIIDAANEYGIPMVFTGRRCFKH